MMCEIQELNRQTAKPFPHGLLGTNNQNKMEPVGTRFLRSNVVIREMLAQYLLSCYYCFVAVQVMLQGPRLFPALHELDVCTASKQCRCYFSQYCKTRWQLIKSPPVSQFRFRFTVVRVYRCPGFKTWLHKSFFRWKRVFCLPIVFFLNFPWLLVLAWWAW